MADGRAFSSGTDRTNEDAKMWKGYIKLQRLNANSSEKTIWSGSHIDAEGNTEPCVLCFPKAYSGDSAIETLQREARILQNLEGSEYIIKVLEFILDWGGEGGTACLVLEEVEPLGYDLFEVFVQHSRSCRPVPMAQVRHYTHQLVQALRHLGSRGTVHRDIKPENVLVDSNQKIRLIDFGFAIQPPEFSFVLPGHKRPEYAAPEIREEGMGDEKIDLWGVGCVLYFLCVGCHMKGGAVKNWDEQGSFDKNLEAMGVHELAIEPIKGLLRQKPGLRWSLDQLDEWATSPELDEPVLTRALSFGVAKCLRRFPYRGIVPAVIGAKLPVDWEPTTIMDLELSDEGKMLVLLVVRNSGNWVKCYPFASSKGPGRAAYRDVFSGTLTGQTPAKETAMEVVTDPNAATVLAPEDWVYFGISEPDSCTPELARAQMDSILERLGISSPRRPGDESDGTESASSLSLARSSRKENLIHNFPEFDGFELPSYCVNAVLGPPQYAKAGQNALNLRRNFRINIAGLHHADDTVTWWPRGGEIVRPGDRGLIVRVPRWTSDTNFISPPTVSLEMLELLLDKEKFRAAMGLKSKDEWKTWTKNFKRLDSGTRAAKAQPCCAVS